MKTIPYLTLTIALLLPAAALAGCLGDTPTGSSDRNVNPNGITGTLQQAGSSTVLPVAQVWSEELAPTGLQVVVAGGGSSAGASKLCEKQVDIGDMSRVMSQSEIDKCRANGVEPLAWKVAFDGLTVVIPRTNTFVDYLSTAELEKIWKPEGHALTWADVRPGWPAERIILYGPDSDSGTYEYFNEAILGKKCGPEGKTQCTPRSDYQPSADDNVLVEGVAKSPYAVGHFGFAYYLENQDRLRAVPILNSKDANATPVEPSFESIRAGAYAPLGRPVYMVTNGKPQEGTPLHAYFGYAMTLGQDVVAEAGYVPLDDATLAEQRAWL